jgi:hypothetical protein
MTAEITVFLPMLQDVGNTILSQIYNTKGKVWVDGTGMVEYNSSAIWSWMNDSTYDLTNLWAFPSAKAIGPNYFAIATLEEALSHKLLFITFKDGVEARNIVATLTYTASIHENFYEGRFYADADGMVVIPVGYYNIDTDVKRTDVFVSDDFGSTWTRYEATDVDGITDVIVDSSGVLWMFVTYEVTPTTQYAVRVSKSEDLGETWSDVNDITLAAGDWRSHSYVDGTDLYLLEIPYDYYGAGPPASDCHLYKSINSGVSFSTLKTWANPIAAYGFAVKDGIICVFLNNSYDPMWFTLYIERSANGLDWTTVWFNETGDYPGYFDNWGHHQMRFDVSNSVWTMTNYSFFRQSDMYLSFFMSTDKGITWENIPSPTNFGSDESSNQYSYDGDSWTVTPKDIRYSCFQSVGVYAIPDAPVLDPYSTTEYSGGQPEGYINEGQVWDPGTMPAFWHGGWFGIDTPRLNKQFRFGQFVYHGTGFQAKHNMIDHETYTFLDPRWTEFETVTKPHIGVNQKAHLHQYYIKFPDADIDCEVLQLSDAYIPRSER